MTLDISNNELAGNIPTWIDRLSSMMILNLHSNKFHGPLPLKLCRLSSLQILDIAYNNISGSIPKCVHNSNAMIAIQYSVENDIEYGPEFLNNTLDFGDYSVNFVENQQLVIKGRAFEYNRILNLVRTIDLSNNNLSGEIPIEVTSLKALQSLNLSRNLLTGRIPESIGVMRQIESIEFSANKLLGEIPQSISNLTSLSILNLSYNLIGKIPSSTLIQSLNASCFIGNKLCGSPLLENCSVNVSTPNNKNGEGKDGKEHEVDWFYVSMAHGFVVGFWSFIGPLLINGRWSFEDDGARLEAE
ncbi:hypothetical protein LWI28_017695 [Acer negundo]|uniref:Uncharacterized protein n=1 Tax=Acer negundo TaxID=4023 RepID=A0AAD5J5E0_ACENE|nr:hypothetical protein LWI28_017695 [Acer negundo]